MLELTIYLLASLPRLERRGRPPMTMPEFREVCHPLLTKRQAEDLDSAELFQSVPKPPRLGALRRWFAREHTLRNELSVLRAARQGADPRRYLRTCEPDPRAAQIASEVFAIESPREAEERLDDLRWDFLEELEFGRDYGVETLALYSLKLQLLQRRAKFDEKAGREWLDGRRKRVEELTRYAIHEFGELGDD